MSTTEYDFPDAIEKIVEIYDCNNNKLTYSVDLLRRKYWFNATPTLPVTLYGTPNKTRTNLSAILLSLDEGYEDIIWQYIVAHAAKQARDPSWKDEMNLADKLCQERRQYRNRTQGMMNNTISFQDRQGKVVDDYNNIENQQVNITNNMGSDDL